MREDNKAQRREQIEAAAYDLLAEKGFQNMSMLAVSKSAKASNETLYRWYGDKIGLFKALIATNAERVATRLREALETSTQLDQALTEIGPVLLSMLLGDRGDCAQPGRGGGCQRGSGRGVGAGRAGQGVSVDRGPFRQAGQAGPAQG